MKEVEQVARDYESGAEEEWQAAGKVANLMSHVRRTLMTTKVQTFMNNNIFFRFRAKSASF